MASSTQPSATSDFYYACRNGLIDQVRQRLPTITLEEIDQVQGNGSTALHAACYYGHMEIVKLLLQKGASRSIRNVHKCLPNHETEKLEIKNLFIRLTNTRFCDDRSDQIEWIKCDAAAECRASEYRFRHFGVAWNSKTTDHHLQYIQNELSDASNDRINVFLNEARKNPLYLLKAHTVESDFYIKINKYLATRSIHESANLGLSYFIDFFYNNPSFGKFSYKGKVYRDMVVTHDEIKQCNVGTKIMNKIFMSTTKARKMAEQYASKSLNYIEKSPRGVEKTLVLCTYETVNDRTALDIEDLSEYKHEKEVLIGPLSTFIITTLRQIAKNYIEIDLRECEKVGSENNGEHEDDFDDD